MRKYPWTEDSVTFMCRAAEQSGYHAMLAQHIGSSLSGTETVYEPGCGTGDLSLLLAPYTAWLTASDINPLPLKALRERADKKAIRNISVLEEDAFLLSDEVSYDTAVFCFFGMREEILAFAKAHIKKDVFIVKRAYKKHRFSSADIPITGDSLSHLCSLLDSRSIPYTKELLSAEMGQPFKSLDEARLFFSLYNRNNEDVLLTDEMLLSRLIKDESKEYPFYLPSRKEVGLIHFHVEDL